MSKVISDALRFHYDEELFNNRWTSELDPTSLVLLQSGVMVESSEIASMIRGGGNYFTIPFYKDIEGEEVNYDGATDIPEDETSDGVQSGVVYGRAKGWKSTIFVNDFTGADPMGNILARIQKWKGKKVQKRVIGILEAILNITGTGEFEDWENHKMDLTASSTTITDENKIGLTTLRDLAVQSLGDNADKFDFAIMHSNVANRLSQFNVLEYFKMNDARGQELDVKVGRNGNLTVLVCDEVPVSKNDTSNALEYTTYVLGRGVLLRANAPVEHPSDVSYDPKKNGGTEMLYTRYREAIHPNGFTFSMSNMPVSPTDAQLEDSANWKIAMKVKNIPIAKLKTN